MTNTVQAWHLWQRFLAVCAAVAVCAAMASHSPAAEAGKSRPNVVLITADDLNFDSVGAYGGIIEGLTPNIDRLASEGLRFVHAYSTVAVCQPVREGMATGLYPHRNGAVGFYPIRPEVRTVNQQMHDAGYLISMVGGKHVHYAPYEKFCVDFEVRNKGRNPTALGAATRKFLALAKAQGKPFFHQVNCNDPHRPFIGSNPKNPNGPGAPPSRVITPEEIPHVPGFLEELPDVRKEVAQYYTTVRRLDDCVGEVLKALDEAGPPENTVVMFYGGDHGMAFPYAKTNCYENSSRGALIFRWPGVIKPGSVDDEHMVATVDFAPTLIELTFAKPLEDIDGRSFLPAIKGEKMPGWDRVFTFYNQTSSRLWLSMRCIRTRDKAYIWNAWSDGQLRYRAENMSGLTWKAMVRAAEANPEIKKRVDFYLYRVPEEFYVLADDFCERDNLIDRPEHQQTIAAMQAELLKELRRSDDPLAEAFAHRDDPAVVEKAKAELADQYPKKGDWAKKAAGKKKK